MRGNHFDNNLLDPPVEVERPIIFVRAFTFAVDRLLDVVSPGAIIASKEEDLQLDHWD